MIVISRPQKMAELQRTISAAKQEHQPNTFAYMEVYSTTKYLSSYIHYYRVSSLQLGLPALSPLAPPPSYVYIYYLERARSYSRQKNSRHILSKV